MDLNEIRSEIDNVQTIYEVMKRAASIQAAIQRRLQKGQ